MRRSLKRVGEGTVNSPGRADTPGFFSQKPVPVKKQKALFLKVIIENYIRVEIFYRHTATSGHQAVNEQIHSSHP